MYKLNVYASHIHYVRFNVCIGCIITLLYIMLCSTNTLDVYITFNAYVQLHSMLMLNLYIGHNTYGQCNMLKALADPIFMADAVHQFLYGHHFCS